MKKVLALTLCIMLIPAFAFAFDYYTFGLTGKVKEVIFGLQILSNGATVDMANDCAAPNAGISAHTNIYGRYNVYMYQIFPANKLFIVQKWYAVARAAYTNAEATGACHQWTFNRANPCEVKMFREDFTLEFNFGNCAP